MIMETVNSTVRPRRVVRRRAQPTLDRAWDTLLCDLPPGVRPYVRAYIENIRDGQEIRSQLSSALTTAGLRWYDVDNIAHKLAFQR
jgi:hypothetical protein